MPYNHCQVQITDIPFLERFSKDINAKFALATFWEFYQNNMEKRKNQEFYCTTSEVARYSLEEVLAIIDKKLLYTDEVKLDYCVVNHHLGYYKKISRLISYVFRNLPFVTFVCNKEGVSTYKLASTDINRESNLYMKLAKAVIIKGAIIQNVLENKASYLDTDRQNIGKPLVITFKKNKKPTYLTKSPLILPKPVVSMEKSTMPFPSQSSNDKVDPFVDVSFFDYTIPKTYFYTYKRRHIQRDDLGIDDCKKKAIKSERDNLKQSGNDLASNKANNVQQVCPHPYMDIKFLLN